MVVIPLPLGSMAKYNFPAYIAVKIKYSFIIYNETIYIFIRLLK